MRGYAVIVAVFWQKCGFLPDRAPLGSTRWAETAGRLATRPFGAGVTSYYAFPGCARTLIDFVNVCAFPVGRGHLTDRFTRWRLERGILSVQAGVGARG